MNMITALACAVGAILLAMPVHANDITKRESQTRRYRLDLQIGPTEIMYTPAETKAKHPTSGEIMLSGKMASGMSDMGHAMAGMMPMSDVRHVELHVYDRDTGKPVLDARVAITLTGADGKRRAVPIARMYGVEEGLHDVHYGNNVALSAGAYTVDTAVNGEHVRFSLKVPQESGSLALRDRSSTGGSGLQRSSHTVEGNWLPHKRVISPGADSP